MTLRTCSSWAGRRSGGAAPSEFPYQSPTSGGSWPVSWEDGGGAEGIRTPFQALVARVAPTLTWTVRDSRGHRDQIGRASCRERVEIAEGAGVVKQKKARVSW